MAFSKNPLRVSTRRRADAHALALAGALALTGLLVAVACSRSPPTRLGTRLRLLERVGSGDGSQGSVAGTVRGQDSPEVRWQDVKGDERPSLVLRTPSSLRFKALAPARASFEFGLAVHPFDAGVHLKLSRWRGPVARTLYEETWQPRRTWGERRVDVGASAGQELDLELSLSGPTATVSIAQPELTGSGADPERPNVIVYVVDCLRADHVGAYGYPRPTTPQVDALARDGVVFERTYACAAWTKPSVGCLLTSLYPAYHGARTVDDALREGSMLLPEILQAQGYATLAVVANPVLDGATFGFHRGFDRYVQLAHRWKGSNVNAVPSDAADITRRVVPWLEENAGRPFFLYLHSLDLHARYEPRPPFDKVFVAPEREGLAREMDLYDNEIAYNDREIGRLVDVLRRLGLYDRTVLLVTADHGEEFEEHGYTRHGHSLFDIALHVPWIMKLPGSVHRGTRLGFASSNLDIAPTLLELAGLPIPPTFQGLGLRGAIESGRAPARDRILAEQISPRETLYAARDARFKYIHEVVPETRDLLFDLEQDPGETRNLLPPFPAAAEPLVADLLRFMHLGQEGYNLAFQAGASSSGFRIEASTEAVFEDVRRLVVRRGDKLSLSADHHRVSYSFTSGGEGRHLILRTNPPGAPLRLSILRDASPLDTRDVVLGGEGRHPDAVPFRVDASAARASLAEVEALGRVKGPPARVWYLSPPPDSRKPSISPELREQMRALGYVR